jgi:hypothetical protein
MQKLMVVQLFVYGIRSFIIIFKSLVHGLP